MSRPGSWSKEDYRARCPLHIAWRDDEIMCRPALPDSAATVHRYQNMETASKQKEIFCSGCYERCEHYQAWKHFNWQDEE